MPLEKGEEAIFLLEVPQRNGYLQARYHEFFKNHGAAYVANVFWIDNDTKKIPIKNGRAYFTYLQNISEPLEEAVRNIKASLKLLEN